MCTKQTFQIGVHMLNRYGLLALALGTACADTSSPEVVPVTSRPFHAVHVSTIPTLKQALVDGNTWRK